MRSRWHLRERETKKERRLFDTRFFLADFYTFLKINIYVTTAVYGIIATDLILNLSVNEYKMQIYHTIYGQL